jgi:D-glycero-D-manno-heptose 1,7-bisphosphate phosphatase
MKPSIRYKPAVFLDRDGTINIEKNYLYKLVDWEWIPGAIEAIKLLNEKNFLVVVVTNQSGIARNKYECRDVELLHTWVSRQLFQHGASIDGYYYCPHHPEHGSHRTCLCRKPQIGMFLEAGDDLGIDFNNSWMIGDKLIDMQAGIAAGVRTIMVSTGHGAIEAKLADDDQIVARDLLEATYKLISCR